jgi:hypothetical protein
VDGLRLVGSYGALKDFLLEGRSSIGGVVGAPAKVELPRAYSWVGSVEYSFKDFVFAGEYRYLSVQDQKFNFEQVGIGTVSVVSSTPSKGWYVSTSYAISDRFSAEIYYSELYPDDDDRGGSRFLAKGQDDFLAWQKDLCVTGRYDISENWILKAAMTFSNGLAGGFPADYPVAGVASEDWILYQFKTTFVF